jgi:hypothetical protein
VEDFSMQLADVTALRALSDGVDGGLQTILQGRHVAGPGGKKKERMNE